MKTIDLKKTKLASVDITSVFNNISVDEPFQIINKSMYEETTYSWSNQQVIWWGNYVHTNITIHFLIRCYHHVDVVAIESPFRRILADIFLAELEEKIATGIKDIILYRWYVDDILVITTTKQQSAMFKLH